MAEGEGRIEFEPVDDEVNTPNIRLLAAAFYLYCTKEREGWEEGPTAEECWSRVCDEIANAIGPSLVDVENAGRWLAANDELIRNSDPVRAYKRIREEVMGEPPKERPPPFPRADVDALVEALSDLVMYADIHPDYPARSVVKTKYVERASAALSRLTQSPPRASGDSTPGLSCPGCGGPTEIDREYPPNPFYCENCEKPRASGDGREENANDD